MQDMYMTTSFGVCLGVGLMLESVLPPTEARLDDSRAIPEKVNISDYDKYYFNLTSLIGRVITSYPTEVVDVLLKNGDVKLYGRVLNKVVDETILISELLDIEVIYYNLTYNKYKNQKMLVESATPAISKVDKMRILVSRILDDIEKDSLIEFYSGDFTLLNKKKSLITTSNALDLLNDNNAELHLLELHTGKLKKRNKFYTKLKVTNPVVFEEIVVLAVGDLNRIIVPAFTRGSKKEFEKGLAESKVMKPYRRYNKSFIIDSVANDESKQALKKIKTYY